MDHLALKGPFGDDLQTSGSGGHAAEKGWVASRTTRRLGFLLVVAFIITSALIVSHFLMNPDSTLSWSVTPQLPDVQNSSLPNEDGVGVQQVCNTSECILAANHLILGMNQTANPCDDFYEYACGNWAKFSRNQGLEYNDNYKPILTSETALVKEILLRQPDSNTFQPAQAAGIVYRHCINGSEADSQDTLKTIIALTDKLGGWPSLEGSDWNENSFDLVTSLAFIIRGYFISDIFFDINLAPLEVNEIVNVPQLSVPTLPSADMLESESYRTAFKSYYTNTLCEVIGLKSRSRHCNTTSSWWSSLQQDADELIKLEKALKLAATTLPQQHSNVTNNPEIFTVEEFQTYLDESLKQSESNTKTAAISWKGLLNKLFGTVGVEINDNQLLIVTNPGYFIRLAKILDGTSKRTIANYVLYSMAFSELPQASGKIYQLATNFFSQTGLPFQSRENYCFSTTMAAFAIPVMHEYLKTKSNLEDRAVLEKIAGNFRATFDKRLERNTWLTDATKLAVRKKLEDLKFIIGYPTWLLNETEIEGRFEGLLVGSNSIEMLAGATQTVIANDLQKLGKDPRTFDLPWFRWTPLVDGLTLFNKYNIHLPSDVVPFYFTNAVVLPMGFIQPHQIYSNVPSYVIYSRAGFVLGHEMLHGFDAARKNLDENGQIYKSWTDDDELKYEERSKCYRDQYSKFELFPGMYLNGSFGLDENIADNDGLKLAYLTYKEQLNVRGSGIDHQSLPGFETLSTEQMFFLSYSSMMCEYSDVESEIRWLQTDSHSPRMFRVNGVLHNLPEFAHAWNCPTGAPMNPVNKCSLW